MEAVQKSVENLLKPVEKFVDTASSSTVQNPVTMMFMTFITVLVITCMAHEIPVDMHVFLCSPMVRFIVMYMYLYTMTKDVKYSVIGALLVHMFYYLFVFSYEKLTLLNDTPEIHPGCKKMTAKDIIDLFGSEEEAKKKMSLMNIPNGIPINDINAPTIATYLINNGKMQVSEACRL